MIEKIFKKQEKVQEKIQKQQELNDKDCRELTDEELEQVVGGLKAVHVVHGVQTAQLAVKDAQVAVKDAQGATAQVPVATGVTLDK